MKEFLPWLVRWAFRAGTRHFCRALAALVSPVQHIIFIAAHFFYVEICLCIQDVVFFGDLKSQLYTSKLEEQKRYILLSLCEGLEPDTIDVLLGV